MNISKYIVHALKSFFVSLIVFFIFILILGSIIDGKDGALMIVGIQISAMISFYGGLIRSEIRKLNK